MVHFILGIQELIRVIRVFFSVPGGVLDAFTCVMSFRFHNNLMIPGEERLNHIPKFRQLSRDTL